MIGKINRSTDFGATLRYVSRSDDLTPLLDTLASNKLANVGAEEMAAEMNNLAMRSRSERPCLHVSLSPEKGDELSAVEWAEASALYIQGVGLESNQYAVYLHHDADYGEGQQERPHAHIVANLVGTDGKQVELPYRDYYKSQEVIRGIETTLGLEHRPSWWEVAQAKAIKQEQAEHQRPTEANREILTGPDAQQQLTGNQDQGEVTRTSSGDRSAEQNRSSEEQQSVIGRRENAPEVDTHNDAGGGDPVLNTLNLNTEESSAADQQSGISSGVQREVSGDETQQQRVEEMGPLFQRELFRSRKAVREDGRITLRGGKHTAIWDSDSFTLAVIENESRDFVMLAECDPQNRWHDQGSRLTDGHCDHFKSIIKREQAQRARQRIKQRQKQKELTL